MERYDVAIVGGGPAGSSCARELVRLGLDVVVLDRARFPRDKTCAGWITPPVAETLDFSLEEYAQSHVLQPIHGFRVGMARSEGIEVDYATPVSFGIRRCELDDFLLRRSGAQLRLGEPLRALERRQGLWELNGQLQAPWVIGAGGHFCPVARQIGRPAAPHTSEPIVAAREIEFELDADGLAKYAARPDIPELYFERDLTGYGWIVRKGRWVNIGLGRQSDASLNDALRRFVSELVELGRIPAAPSGRFHGHAYLLHGQTDRSPAVPGALLVGDALGLAGEHSGEGILRAIESGILAARAIARAPESDRDRATRDYPHALTERYGTGASPAGAALAACVPQDLRERMGARLLASRAFVRHVVLDRWFLHRSEAALPPT